MGSHKKKKSIKKTNKSGSKHDVMQPKKIKLAESTALKSIEKGKKKKSEPVWVKTATIEYELELKKLQIELLKMQNYIKARGKRCVMLFEGRDAAGKGGTIKRIIQYLNPRGARVVALEKPSNKEQTQWFFQRYVQHLPSAGEMVLFARSWYNRAMVEPIMGFCTDLQNKRFIKDVPMFEEMLVKDGIIFFKFYFSVSKKEQLRRFDSREVHPLKQYKISPVDKLAQDLWDQYTVKKFQMLSETNRTIAPWIIIRSDNKKKARLNCIKHILTHIQYDDRIDTKKLQLDPNIIISGIDELKYMEEHLLSPETLPG
jgi:polyphosphate kinase 2